MYSFIKFTLGSNTKGNLYINPLGLIFCYLLVAYIFFKNITKLIFGANLLKKGQKYKSNIFF